MAYDAFISCSGTTAGIKASYHSGRGQLAFLMSMRGKLTRVGGDQKKGDARGTGCSCPVRDISTQIYDDDLSLIDI